MKELGKFTEHCGCGACDPVDKKIIGVVTPVNQKIVAVFGDGARREAHALATFLEIVPYKNLNENNIETLENLSDVLLLTPENLREELDIVMFTGSDTFASSNDDIEKLKNKISEFIYR